MGAQVTYWSAEWSRLWLEKRDIPASSSTAEQWAFNPLVRGSNPRGQTMGHKKIDDPLNAEYERVLFHWSPSKNRNSINKTGLVPGRLSYSTSIKWRPPYISLSENPDRAWRLSGAFHPEEPQTWDLWMVHACSIRIREPIAEYYKNSDKRYVREIRVYERIYKRHLTWVATRTTIKENEK